MDGIAASLRALTDATIRGVAECFRNATGDPCISAPLCLNDATSPVLLSVCPPAQRVTRRCDYTLGSVIVCTQYDGLAVSGESNLSIVCEFRDHGTWGGGPCSTTSLVGRCMRSVSGIAVVDYITAGTLDDARTFCSSVGGTFATP